MSDLVSIVMPAYNVHQFIVESIKSVQDQIYTNWELIVINDGSTDDTRDIVQAMAQNDRRIRVIDQKNAGVSAARNRGLSLATGKYIAFLDSDDLWKPEFLQELISAKARNNADMAYCGYNHFTNLYCRPYRYQYPSGWILPQAIQGTVRIHLGALIADKSLLDENNFRFTEGCAIGEDWELIIKLVTVAKVQSVPKNLMLYRVRAGSAITSKWNWQKHIDAVHANKRVINYIMQQYDTDPVKQNTLLPLLNEGLAYRVFRFLWRMIKSGYYEDALKLIYDVEFSKPLRYLNIEKLNLIERFKYQSVISKNKVWWKMMSVLK